jgi:hypothetical protein
MTETIYVQVDGEKREASAEEINYIQETQSATSDFLQSEKEEKDLEISARTSALAKLAALGLTEEEIAAL